MPYPKQLALGVVVGLAVAAFCGFSCASILGVDDYKVSTDNTGAGGTASTGAPTSTTRSMGTGGSTGTGGLGGASGLGNGGTGGVSVGGPDGGGMGGGPAPCSGATPQGAKMCGPGMTCLTRVDCAYGCFPSGSGAEGSACTAGSDCSAGMICIQYDATAVCRSLCGVDADCPTGFRCSDAFSCNGVAAGKYCARACSDVTVAGSAACGAGFKCSFGCDGQIPTPTTCDWEAGAVQSGGACTTQSECARGYNCIDNVCFQGCRTNADCAVGACTETIFCGPSPTSFHYCH